MDLGSCDCIVLCFIGEDVALCMRFILASNKKPMWTCLHDFLVESSIFACHAAGQIALEPSES